MKSYQFANPGKFMLERWVKAVYNRLGRTLPKDWEIGDRPYYGWDGQNIRMMDKDTSCKIKDTFPMRRIEYAIVDPLWTQEEGIEVGDPVYLEVDGQRVYGTYIGCVLSVSAPYVAEVDGVDVAGSAITKARKKVALSWEEIEDMLDVEITIK